MHVSTFRLYDSTLATLRERLPLILDSQRANLALLVAAAAQAGTLWVDTAGEPYMHATLETWLV